MINVNLRQQNRWWALGLAIFLLLLGFLLFKLVAHLIDTQTRVLNENAQRVADEQAQAGKIVITETQNGKKQWVIETEKADYNPKKTYSNLEVVKGQVYDPNGEIQFDFRSAKARYYKAEKRMELYGGIHLDSPKSKVSVMAGQLNWSSQSDMMTASGGVVLNKPGKAQSQSSSAVFSKDFSYMAFTGGVSTQIH